MPTRKDRRAAERAGRRMEFWTALRLRLGGARLLARRGRCPAGEIDLLARRGGLLIVVEVKRRAAFGPDGPVAPAQWRRIARAAELARARLAPDTDRVRFDLVWGRGPGRWRYLRDAWRP